MAEQVVEEKKEEKLSIKQQIEKIKGKPSAEYHLTYDSRSEGVEPIYFWILDFMRDSSGLGLGDENVWKYKDEYDAAVASGFFSEMGSRVSQMQDRAMKLMASINAIIRSIINLLYDLREFEIRLESYDDLESGDSDKREAAELALKQVWMDKVDIQRGVGSINMMVQRLEFVTLRDAFMAAKDEADVDKMDLNDRVKRILKPRISEYLKWLEYSEKELRKRFKIEKSYLKSQVASLKYYTKWTKPYLIAAHKLGLRDFRSPDIVNAFNSMELHLGLFGIEEVKPDEVDEKYEGLKLEKKFYACIEAEIRFRTVPQAFRGEAGSRYVHAGRTDVTLKSYAMSSENLDKLKELKEKEDFELIDEMTDESLDAIQEDLDKYIKGEEEEEEKKKKKPKFEWPFGNVLKGFGDALSPVGNIFKGGGSSYIENRMKKVCAGLAAKKCYALYDIYKKAHGMVTW